MEETFIVCTVASLYDANMRHIGYTFRDLLTDKIIIINPVYSSQIDQMINAYIRQHGICNVICLEGQFGIDEQYVYSMSISAVHITNFTATICYIDCIDKNTMIFRDVHTDTLVQIKNMPKAEYNSLNNSILDYMKSSEVEVNFDKNGDTKIAIIGESIDFVNDSYIYEYNDIVLLNTIEGVINELYNYIK